MLKMNNFFFKNYSLPLVTYLLIGLHMTHIFLGNTKNADRNGAKNQRTPVEIQHQSRLVRMRVSYSQRLFLKAIPEPNLPNLPFN